MVSVPSDPNECYALSPFGFGPFPDPNDPGAVVVCPPHPSGSGYGGAAFDPNDPSEGGTPYGLGSYGSTTFAAPTVAVSGGYGGDPYGTGPYGSIAEEDPTVTSAQSLNGYEIEVFFSIEMDPEDPLLTDPASYDLTPIYGAPSTTLSVTIEQLGDVDVGGGDFIDGVLSVVLLHTGTTLGGTYTVTVDGPINIYGNPIVSSSVNLLTQGATPTYTVSPQSDSELLLTFSEDMLEAVDEPAGTTGIEATSSYEFTSDPDYPIAIEPLSVDHPYLGNEDQVLLTVQGQTSLDYTSNVVPALGIDYDQTVLPDADTGLNGVEVNAAGGSSTIVASGLSLSKTSGSTYGWLWQDTSGVIQANTTTFRADVSIDASSAVFDPVLSTFVAPEVAVITVEDSAPGGGVQIVLTLFVDSGTDKIRIESGAWNVEVEADWRSAPTTISVLRNLKADIYSVVQDDAPLASVAVAGATATAATIGAPGVAFTFTAEAYDVSGFLVEDVVFTASNTVFSQSWNFLHEETSTFTGDDSNTRDTLLTQKGPLVKGWGDATLATKNDVTVRISGVEVEVARVNPYIGEITLAVPVPLLPLGHPDADVSVDYQWFDTPLVPMLLNTEGSVLNKWDRTTGHTDPAYHRDASTEEGFAETTSRFRMGQVLGPYGTLDRPEPVQIAHRYIGFERAYSAMLNNPTTLRLNNSPNRTLRGKFDRVPPEQRESYEATVTPLNFDPAWDLNGTDSGNLNELEGTYTVIDAEDGSFDPDDPTAVVYSREVDLTFPSRAVLYARFLVDLEATDPDGVFTGVGFGLHDNRRMYLVGALLINDVQHVGLLLDPERPYASESWYIGSQVSTEITSSSTIEVAASDLPTPFGEGDRFQILEGNQAGVYTVTGADLQDDCVTMVLTVTPDFPADFNLFGNRFPTIVPEIDWSSSPSTYRLDVDLETSSTQLQVSGATTATILSLDEVAVDPFDPEPANTSLLLDTSEEGQIFWGSLSMGATSESTWSFFRYGIIPDRSVFTSLGITVDTDMTAVPEDSDPEWYRLQTFGYSEVDSTGTRVLLKSTSGSQDIDSSYAYSRLEPFLTDEAILDLSTTFQVESGSLGAGDGQIRINSGDKTILVSTLLYREYPGELTFRRLIDLPQISMSGLRLPTVDSDWSQSSTFGVTATVRESILTIDQPAGATGGYQGTLDTSDLDYTDNGSRIIEGRFAVTSYTTNGSGDTGPMFGADVGVPGGPFRFVGLTPRAPFGSTPAGVRLIEAGGTVIEEFDFDWTDGEVHTYRVLADTDSDTVVLVIDDVVQTPTVDLTLFGGGSGNTAVFFGAIGLDPTLASTVEWHSMSVVGLPPSDAKRTLGIWLGGDKSSLNSWEIPRTDSTSLPNTSEVGPVVEEMDWTAQIDVRILRDSGWGVTLYRPDLGLPPYYVSETDGVPGSGFITSTTEPSAGWINVEEAEIPQEDTTFGSIAFGAIDPESISQQRWSEFEYRFFKNVDGDAEAPSGMVLNRYNVIHSGELAGDVTPEVFVVSATSSTTVSLRPIHIYASRVFKVIDGGMTYTQEAWEFDDKTQILTLVEDSEGNPRSFSSEDAALTVVFAPGDPVTKTYLEAQPIGDALTLLNEGTPPYPKSQLATTDSVIDSSDPDGYKYRYFTDGEGFYDDMCFIEQEDDGERGLLSTMCETFTGRGTTGWNDSEQQIVGGLVFEFSGLFFSENMNLMSSHTSGSNTLLGPYEGGAGLFGDYLYASGGDFYSQVYDSNGDPVPGEFMALGGNLSPGSAILYPSPASGTSPTQDRVYSQIDWYIRIESVFTDSTPGAETEADLQEVIDIESTLSDNTAPLYEDFYESNPDGTVGSGGTGAALMVLTTPGDYSRYGPWGGLSTLEPAQDKGFFEFESTIADGTEVTITERDSSTSVTFTARATPTLANEFAISPQPHVNLANAINDNPTTSAWVIADSGLSVGGDPSTSVTAINPVGLNNDLTISSSDLSSIRIANVIRITSTEGFLTGGVGLTQSSLVAGGSTTLVDNLHEDKEGIIVEGGSPLPLGDKRRLVVEGA